MITVNAHPHAARLRHRPTFLSTGGMTLIEITMTLMILTIVMGALFTLSIGLGDTARVQDIRINTSDETRKALITIGKELREAGMSTVTGLPGPSVSYRVATDLDGNASAVDVGGNLELSPTRTIQRDTADANSDTLTALQLVLTTPTANTVLANGLVPDEDANHNGVLETGEDTNLNGALDHGIWFERAGNGIRVTIQTEGTDRRGRLFTWRLSQVVLPRN